MRRLFRLTLLLGLIAGAVAFARRAWQRLPGRPASEAEPPLANEAPPSAGDGQLPATGAAAESSAEPEAGPQAGERPEA